MGRAVRADLARLGASEDDGLAGGGLASRWVLVQVRWTGGVSALRLVRALVTGTRTGMVVKPTRAGLKRAEKRWMRRRPSILSPAAGDRIDAWMRRQPSILSPAVRQPVSPAVQPLPMRCSVGDIQRRLHVGRTVKPHRARWACESIRSLRLDRDACRTPPGNCRTAVGPRDVAAPGDRRILTGSEISRNFRFFTDSMTPRFCGFLGPRKVLDFSCPKRFSGFAYTAWRTSSAVSTASTAVRQPVTSSGGHPALRQSNRWMSPLDVRPAASHPRVQAGPGSAQAGSDPGVRGAASPADTGSRARRS